MMMMMRQDEHSVWHHAFSSMEMFTIAPHYVAFDVGASWEMHPDCEDFGH